MPITLTPEQEEAVRADAKVLGYGSPEEYLAVRLADMHAGASFFFETREEFEQIVEEGLASADRGELMSGEEAKADVERRKAEFMRNSSSL